MKVFKFSSMSPFDICIFGKTNIIDFLQQFVRQFGGSASVTYAVPAIEAAIPCKVFFFHSLFHAKVIVWFRYKTPLARNRRMSNMMVIGNATDWNQRLS